MHMEQNKSDSEVSCHFLLLTSGVFNYKKDLSILCTVVLENGYIHESHTLTCIFCMHCSCHRVSSRSGPLRLFLKTISLISYFE